MKKTKYDNLGSASGVMRADEQLRAAIVCPAPDDGFVKQLRGQLDRKAAAMQASAIHAAAVQAAAIPRGRLRWRRWAFAFGSAVVLMAILITSAPTMVTAMKRMILGYMNGIGLVEEDPTLRILAEPVSLTRGNFTVKVDHALLYSDRTIIHYQVESVTSYPFPEPGDNICLEYAHLRLPDGSTLQPQPMGDGKALESGYEFATSFADPIPSDVTQATLVIPCLLDSVRGTAPENWELALSFTPAPPNMELAPVHDAATAQTATDQGITVDLENVVAEEDGYIFNFSLRLNQDGDPKPDLYPGSLAVIDATGQKILVSNASGRPPMPQNAPEPFAFRTSAMPAPGPLTLKLDAIRATFRMPDIAFTFDPGSDPQPGQVWSLDEHISVAGYEWDITSARMVVQDGGPTVGEIEGFAFTMQAANPGMMVQLMDTAHPLAVCEPGFPKGTVFSSTLTYENGMPAGPITVTVSEASVLIPGDWEIRWAPLAE
jgi:hypothetical protein